MKSRNAQVLKDTRQFGLEDCRIFLEKRIDKEYIERLKYEYTVLPEYIQMELNFLDEWLDKRIADPNS